MAEYTQFITHKGKRMLFVNGAGLEEAEILAAFEEMKHAVDTRCCDSDAIMQHIVKSPIICYCFCYSEADIVEDVLKNQGQSLILERVAEARRTLTCQCDDRHPEKR